MRVASPSAPELGCSTQPECTIRRGWHKRGVALAAGLVLAAAAGFWPVGGAEAQDGQGVDTAADPASERTASSEIVLVAAPGDTIWSLALPHAPAGVDPHDFVNEVALRSGIDAGTLHPGDVLRVPTG